MPALSPEQRRKQIELQKQREAAFKAKNKPKPGQKGVATSGGSRTKSQTIGGAKPAAKPAAKPTSKTKVADYKDSSGNTYDGNTGRLKSSAKPKPSPKASTSPVKAPAAASRSSVSSVTAKAPSRPAEKKLANSNVGPVSSGNDYARNKDPKKYNPLMQKTFGYQSGDAPDQRAKRANYAEKDTGVNPSTKVDGSKFKAGSASNKTEAAFDSKTNLLDNKPNSITEAAKKRQEEKRKNRFG